MKNGKIVFLIFLSIFVLSFITYMVSLKIFEPKAYNFMSKLTASKASNNNVVIVTIDDKALSEISSWPWNRNLYSEIFDFLNNYTETKVIGFDSLLYMSDENTKYSDKKFFNDLKKFDKLVVGTSFYPEIINTEIDNNYYDKIFKEKNIIKFLDKRSSKLKYSSNYVSFTPFPVEYLENVSSIGSVITPLDTDGYTRRMEQVIEYKGNLYPSLALSLYSKYTGIKNFLITNKKIYAHDEKYELSIPIYHHFKGASYNYIKWYKTDYKNYAHKNYSAADIIKSYRALKKGQYPILDVKTFDGKIVLVGANANAKALQDYLRTPIAPNYPGVDIQATNLSNLLNNEFIKNTSQLVNILVVIFVSIFVFLIVKNYSVSISLGISALIALVYLMSSYIFYKNNIAINVVTPELFILMALAIGYSYKFILEGQKKEKIQQAMGKYISTDIMKNVIKNIDEVKLGGKKAEVTILFADIRGFTSISEKLPAEQVSTILNEYFTEIIPIIQKYNGVLNKFIGDAVLAIFGEPIQDKNHAINAVKCGNHLLKRLKSLQQKWIEEGKPKIDIGVAIATGEVFVGNIGSEERLEYTVIGDTVNVANRIEGYNKIYRTKFLISEKTYQKVKSFVDVIKISEVTIRGRVAKMNIYEVLRLNSRRN